MGSDWDQKLKHIARDINLSINKTTRKAPYEALYGYLPCFAEGGLRLLTEGSETYRPASDIQQEVWTAIEKNQAAKKAKYDGNRNIRI